MLFFMLLRPLENVTRNARVQHRVVFIRQYVNVVLSGIEHGRTLWLDRYNMFLLNDLGHI